MSWPVCHSMPTVAKILIGFVQVVSTKVEANLKLKSFFLNKTGNVLGKHSYNVQFLVVYTKSDTLSSKLPSLSKIASVPQVAISVLFSSLFLLF